jgi:hypothetical protein
MRMARRKELVWKLWAVVDTTDPELWTPTLHFSRDQAEDDAQRGGRVIQVEVREIRKK